MAEAGEGDLGFVRRLFFGRFFGRSVGCGQSLAVSVLRLASCFGVPVKVIVAAFGAGVGADLDDVVGVFDDVELVLDDEERVAGVGEAMEDAEEDFDVGEVEAGGGLVEDEKSVDACPWCR